MVAHLVRLKLTLLRNGLRRSPWQVVGLVFGTLYGLFIAVIMVAGMFALSSQPLATRSTVVVVGGAVVVLGWWLVPLVAFGVDATLDPTRFATFPVPRRPLLVGLMVSGLIGVPGVITTVVSLATVVLWWREPFAAALAPVGAVLQLAACILGSRALLGVLAPLLERRRVRELLTAAGVLAMISLGPAFGALGNASSHGSAAWTSIARVLGWTPAGLGWALPVDVAAHRWVTAGLRLVLAVAVLALLALVWDRTLTRSLVDPPRSRSTSRAKGLGWFGRMPGTATGAVAARAATYWTRDPRYAMAIALVPLMPVLLAVNGLHSRALLISGPIAGFIIGWSISADVAYDGSAFWLHVASPVRGVVDRRGRAVVVLALGGLACVLLSVASALLAGKPQALPALLGASFGLLLTSAGVASVTSALFVYRVQQSGESPFTVRQGASMAAFVSQMIGWSIIALLASPAVVLGVLAVLRDNAGLGWAALLVGPVVGAGVLVAGLRLGGSVLSTRAPELLATMRSYT